MKLIRFLAANTVVATVTIIIIGILGDADLRIGQVSVAKYFDYNHHERRHSSIDYIKSYQLLQQQLATIA